MPAAIVLELHLVLSGIDELTEAGLDVSVRPVG